MLLVFMLSVFIDDEFGKMSDKMIQNQKLVEC